MIDLKKIKERLSEWNHNPVKNSTYNDFFTDITALIAEVEMLARPGFSDVIGIFKIDEMTAERDALKAENAKLRKVAKVGDDIFRAFHTRGQSGLEEMGRLQLALAELEVKQ